MYRSAPRLAIKSVITILFSGALSIFLPSCQPGSKDAKGFRDFQAFYEKFHQDSVFQLNHINFPLEGIPDNAGNYEGDLNSFRWEKESWQVHRPIDFEKSGYKQELNTFSDNMVVERIVHESGDYAMMRRFARLGDEWYLIYYAGLNSLNKAQ